MLKEVEVRIGTKFVHLPYVDGAVANYLNDLCQKLTHTQTFTNYRGEQVTTEGDTFYYKSESGTEFRFPICMREEVLYRLEGNLSPEQIKVTKVEPEFGDDVSIEVWDKFTYKEGQENFVDFLVDQQHNTRILPAVMGAGKTVSALVAISRIGKRAVIFIKPRYQSTWFKDMSWLLPNEKEGEDYIWVSGGDELKALINKAVNKEPLPKIVLISAPTFQTYVNKHNSFKLAKNDIGGVYKTQQLIVEDYNGVGPEDFFRVCGFGTKTVDEAHEEMAYNAVLDSFNPLFNNLYLTATLEAEHGIKKEMQEKVYPRELRCKVPPPVKHVHMVGVNYRLDFFAKPLKHKSPMGYSHVTFEKSLMTQPKRRNEYFKMITRLLLEYGREGLENGHKVLIWFSTKNMITAYLKYSKPLVGDKYQVVQYVAGTSKDALKADIIISTPGRSSTGLDLPGLCTCINTIAASSKNLNLQMFGRIRQLKEGVDLNPYYVYPYTQDIQKHVQYHKKRKQDHQDWYLTFSERFYPERI